MNDSYSNYFELSAISIARGPLFQEGPSRPLSPLGPGIPCDPLFITNLSLSTVLSLESLRPGNAWHSRHTIGSWDARKTHYRPLKKKVDL